MRRRILIKVYVKYIAFGVVKRACLDDRVLTSKLKTYRVIDIAVKRQHHLLHSPCRSKCHRAAFKRYLTLDTRLVISNLISLEKVSLEIERDERLFRIAETSQLEKRVIGMDQQLSTYT